MRVSDDRYSRDIRRYELAWKLIGFDARTRVIERWAGLSSYRIRTLYRSYAAGEPSTAGSPLRGVAPTQVRFFWRSAHIKCEAAILAGLLRTFNVIPTLPSDIAPESLPGLARGERLCRAYAEYRSLLPSSAITIEHAMLLLTELVRGVEMKLDHCDECGTLMLVDRLSIGSARCAYCAYEAQAGLPYGAGTNVFVHQDAPVEQSAPQPTVSPLERQGRLF